MSEHLVLVALRLAIVTAGALAALFGLRMGLRSPENRRTYLLLASGFGFVTLGAVVEGILFEFAGWDLVAVHTLESFASAMGFALVLVGVVRSTV